MHISVDGFNFCDGPRMSIHKVKTAVHQQHMNCLIDAWACTG